VRKHPTATWPNTPRRGASCPTDSYQKTGRHSAFAWLNHSKSCPRCERSRVRQAPDHFAHLRKFLPLALVPLDPFIDQPGFTLMSRLSWYGQPVCPGDEISTVRAA
jgi:hypothetical protein